MMKVSGTQSIDILIDESQQIKIACAVIREKFDLRKDYEIDTEKMIIFKSWQVRSFTPLNIDVIRDLTAQDIAVLEVLEALEK